MTNSRTREFSACSTTECGNPGILKSIKCPPRSALIARDLARDLRRGKQRVSPFYHDLGLDVVGLIGNFWIVEQIVHLVVEQLLNPILSSSHVSRRSLEEDDVMDILSRTWLLQFQSEQLSEPSKLGVFREA